MATKKRLIDADALVLENSILMEDEYGLPFKCVPEEDIRYAPTVDAVEVVRCKECVSVAGNDVKGYMCQNQLCPCYRRNVTEDFSCICGERRPDGIQ